MPVVNASSTPPTGTVLGIEIGGTKLQIVAGSELGIIQDRVRFNVDREKGGEGIRAQIASVLASLAVKHQARAVGVGFGGPIDRGTGAVACSHQIHGWSGFGIRSWLQGLCGLPVSVDNDANVAALAEATLGAGSGHDPVFYVTLGSGVGGGLVSGRRIYHGASPGESEIGHLRLDRTGMVVEQRCSGWAVDRRIRDSVSRHPGSLLASMVAQQPGGEARHLASAVAQGDVEATNILGEVCDDLAFALSHVVHLNHPQMIVLGGGLSLVGPPLRDGVASRITRYTMEVFHPGPEVSLAKLSEDAVPAGALLLASQTLRGA
ncbi:MAG: ROK family protein [Verrucomicrobia bacterium]|nr:ROK family protein [Verrucomicrobiota bacterium]